MKPTASNTKPATTAAMPGLPRNGSDPLVTDWRTTNALETYRTGYAKTAAFSVMLKGDRATLFQTRAPTSAQTAVASTAIVER
jgi:hypothetical protein